MCAKCEANILPDQGFTVFRLPRSHYHCRLQEFDWAAVTPPSLQKHVTQFFYDTLAEQPRHLILTGPPGSGKTHIGVGLYRAVAASIGTELCTWVNVPSFCESVKRGYEHKENDPWPDYEGARRLVVLDDLFGREFTPHEKDQIVTRLLDTAYTNGAAVVITMNPPAEELAQRLPPHEISRVLANSMIIPVRSTKDWRRA